MYVPFPRSTFWQNCIFGLLVDISSLSQPQILIFSPSSLLLTRLILTSRNSYCLVHHLGPITRPLIILIVRERVLAIIVSFVFFRFNRSSSTVTTCMYTSMDHIPRSVLIKMLTQDLTRGGRMNCGIRRI